MKLNDFWDDESHCLTVGVHHPCDVVDIFAIVQIEVQIGVFDEHEAKKITGEVTYWSVNDQEMKLSHLEPDLEKWFINDGIAKFEEYAREC